MARHNGLDEKEQDQIIQEIRCILRYKFKFPFDIRRMTNHGGRELYIFSKDKGLEKMKMYFCRHLDFDSDSILGHCDSRDDLAIRIDTLRQNLIDSIKSEYKSITNGNHKDLESGHHLLETNGKVVPLSMNEIFPPPQTPYKSIIPNPIFVNSDGEDVNKILRKNRTAELAAQFKKLNFLLKQKFEVQTPIKTKEKMNAKEKDSSESSESVKKEYTGAKRGPKTRTEKSLTQKKENLVNAYQLKVLSFLKYVLGVEDRLKPFGPAKTADNRLCYFHEVVEGSYYYLVCRNDSVRDVAFEALSYSLDHKKYPRTLKVGERNTIHSGHLGVNFRLMKHWKKEDLFSFCLPPKIGATPAEIRNRLEKIRRGSPDVGHLGDLFLISYQTKEIVQKMFSLTSGMGWNVSNLRETDFTIDLRSISENKKVESKAEEIIAPSFKPSILPTLEKVFPAPVITPSPQESLTLDKKLHLLIRNNEEEALYDLDKIFFDIETFNKLSTEMADNIAAILKESYRKRQPEEYAKLLLKILGK